MQRFLIRDKLAVGIDLGADNAAVLTNECILNAVDAIKLLLNLLWRDIFAVGQNDEVLAPPCEEYVSVFVFISEIAGMKPAVVKCLTRCDIVSVISG